MKQVDWKAEDTLFPVKEIPAITSGSDSELLETGYKFIIREDTNDIISCMTDEYKLVDNRTLFDTAKKVINPLGGKLVEARTFKNKRTMYKWRFKDVIKLGDQEEHKPEIIINNSYDGSCEIQVLAGAFRLVCSNGMVIGTIIDRSSNRHSVWNKSLKDIEEVIVNAIEATAELLDEGFSEMRRDKPKQKHIKAFFKLFPTQANEQITQYLMAHTPKTYWDLFNAGTWVLSHGMNRKSWSTSHLESSLFKTVNTWAKA
mgnify:CR=1 FL=1